PMRWPVPPPPPADWTRIAESARAVAESEHQLERARWAVDRERAALAARVRYLGIGATRVQRERGELDASAALIDSLRGTLEALDARLKSVRDDATRNLLERSAGVLAACTRDLLWLGGMRALYLNGPGQRGRPVPSGAVPADSVVAAEESL